MRSPLKYAVQRTYQEVKGRWAGLQVVHTTESPYHMAAVRPLVKHCLMTVQRFIKVVLCSGPVGRSEADECESSHFEEGAQGQD